MLAADSLQNVKQGSTKSNVIENLADEYQKSNEPLKKAPEPILDRFTASV